MYPNSMQMSPLPAVLVTASLTSMTQAVILTDDFTGGLNPTLWDGSPFIENSGMISAVNDRLEFSASPAADLFDANHFGSFSASSVVSGNDSWTVDVLSFLAPTGDFGTFGLNEAIALTLTIENTNNSQDNLEVSLVAGDPFGNGSSDKQIRVGLRNDGSDETPLVSGLLGSIGATDLKLSHDATSGLVTISYDTGGGEVVLGSQDISAWDFDADKNLTLALGGGAFSTDTTIQSGTIEALSGEAYFDNLVINSDTSIPEPSSLALGTLGLLAFLRRKR